MFRYFYLREYPLPVKYNRHNQRNAAKISIFITVDVIRQTTKQPLNFK